jgi:hypothetical protein
VLGLGEFQQRGLLAADAVQLPPRTQHYNTKLLGERGKRELGGEAGG